MSSCSGSEVKVLRLSFISVALSYRPIQRNSSEVRQLGLHLSHFPDLTPDPNPPAAVLEGLAARVLGECLPKGGFACESHIITLCSHGAW